MPVSTLNTQPHVEMKMHTSHRPSTLAIFIAVVTLAVLSPALAAAQDATPTESEEAAEATDDAEATDETADTDEKTAAKKDESEDKQAPKDEADDSERQEDAAQEKDEAAAPAKTEEDTKPEATDESPAKAETSKPAEKTPAKAPKTTTDAEETAEETGDEPDTKTADEATEETAAKGAGDASEPAAEEPTDDADEGGVQAGYDGGFYLETKDGAHKVKLSGGFTPRLNYTDVEEPSSEGDEYQFLVRRARVKVSGHAFTPRLGWEIQLGLGGNVRLLSANLEYEILEDALYFYAGQDRLPYMREQVTSHWRLQFSERSIVEDQFGEGYDTGIALHNFKRDGFEWSVGLYNGTESDLPTNAPADISERMFEPAVAARIGWSSEGLNGYTEGDVEGGPLRFGVGLTALSQLALPEEAERADKVGLDVVLKAHGFSLVAAGHTAARSAGEGFFDQEIFVSGVRAQAGYVIASQFEPVVRYAVVIPRADDTSTQEARGGLNVYFVGHKLKLQADFGAVTRRTPGVESTDWNGRLQGVVRF